MVKVDFKIRVSVIKDAWNVWDACNSSSHGMDWSKWAGPKLQKNVVGKKYLDAKKWLHPFLKEHYKKIGLTETAKSLRAMLEPEFPRVIETIERITQKPFYLKEVILFVTTYPRCPYYWRKGYIWIRHDKDKNWQIHTLLHELLHFQFHHYYGQRLRKKITEEEFEALKEAMVVILDDDLKNWTGKQETTYSIYKKFSEELRKIWQKTRGNFKKFVDEGVAVVGRYNF